MNRIISIFACGLLLASINCPLSADDAVVLGHLEMRGYKITIVSQTDGLRYVLTQIDSGKLVASVTEEQLRTQYSDVYRKLNSAIANDTRTEGSFIWAGQ